MTPLRPEAQKLVAFVRQAEALPSSQRACMRAQLLAKIQAGSAPPAGSGSPVDPAAMAQSAGSHLVFGKVILSGLVLVSAGAVALKLGTTILDGPSPAPEEVRAPMVLPTPAPTIEPMQDQQLAPESTAPPTPVQTKRTGPTEKSKAAGSAPGRDLQGEAALLLAARRALSGHDPERSLALLAQYRAKYGTGILAEEWSALSVRANCAAKDAPSADHALARFRAEFPSSSLLPGVLEACGRPPPAPAPE